MLLCSIFAIGCQRVGGPPVAMEAMTGETSKDPQIFLSIISKDTTFLSDATRALELRTFQLRACAKDSICSTDTVYVYLSAEQKDQLRLALNTLAMTTKYKRIQDLRVIISRAEDVTWQQEVDRPHRIHVKAGNEINIQFH